MPQADWNTVTGYGIEAEKKAFLQSADKVGNLDRE